MGFGPAKEIGDVIPYCFTSPVDILKDKHIKTDFLN